MTSKIIIMCDRILKKTTLQKNTYSLNCQLDKKSAVRIKLIIRKTNINKIIAINIIWQQLTKF